MDLVIDAVAVKLKAMEDAGRGFNADGGVTMYDRLIVILGTSNRKYIDRLLDTEPRASDIEKVVETIKKHGLDVTPEEVVVIGKLRRLIIEKAKNERTSILLEKILDIDGGLKGMNSDLISISQSFPLLR